jgi:hypothetical protein
MRSLGEAARPTRGVGIEKLERPVGQGYTPADQVLTGVAGHRTEGRVDVEVDALRREQGEAVVQVSREAADESLLRLEAVSFEVGDPRLGLGELAKKITSCWVVCYPPA